MKTFILKVTMMLGVLTTMAFPCHITFEPESIKAPVDSTVDVKVIVHWEHRRCELDVDDVNFDYVGAKQVKLGDWTKVKQGLYTNIVKVKVTDDFSSMRVWRECTKKGISEATILLGKKVKLEKNKDKKKKLGCNGDCANCPLAMVNK